MAASSAGAGPGRGPQCASSTAATADKPVLLPPHAAPSAQAPPGNATDRNGSVQKVAESPKSQATPHARPALMRQALGGAGAPSPSMASSTCQAASLGPEAAATPTSIGSGSVSASCRGPVDFQDKSASGDQTFLLGAHDPRAARSGPSRFKITRGSEDGEGESVDVPDSASQDPSVQEPSQDGSCTKLEKEMKEMQNALCKIQAVFIQVQARVNEAVAVNLAARRPGFEPSITPTASQPVGQQCQPQQQSSSSTAAPPPALTPQQTPPANTPHQSPALPQAQSTQILPKSLPHPISLAAQSECGKEAPSSMRGATSMPSLLAASQAGSSKPRTERRPSLASTAVSQMPANEQEALRETWATYSAMGNKVRFYAKQQRHLEKRNALLRKERREKKDALFQVLNQLRGVRLEYERVFGHRPEAMLSEEAENYMAEVEETFLQARGGDEPIPQNPQSSPEGKSQLPETETPPKRTSTKLEDFLRPFQESKESKEGKDTSKEGGGGGAQAGGANQSQPAGAGQPSQPAQQQQPKQLAQQQPQQQSQNPQQGQPQSKGEFMMEEVQNAFNSMKKGKGGEPQGQQPTAAAGPSAAQQQSPPPAKGNPQPQDQQQQQKGRPDFLFDETRSAFDQFRKQPVPPSPANATQPQQQQSQSMASQSQQTPQAPSPGQQWQQQPPTPPPQQQQAWSQQTGPGSLLGQQPPPRPQQQQQQPQHSSMSFDPLYMQPATAGQQQSQPTGDGIQRTHSAGGQLAQQGYPSSQTGPHGHNQLHQLLSQQLNAHAQQQQQQQQQSQASSSWPTPVASGQCTPVTAAHQGPPPPPPTSGLVHPVGLAPVDLAASFFDPHDDSRMVRQSSLPELHGHCERAQQQGISPDTEGYGAPGTYRDWRKYAVNAVNRPSQEVTG